MNATGATLRTGTWQQATGALASPGGRRTEDWEVGLGRGEEEYLTGFVVVGESLIGTELGKNVLEAEKVGMESRDLIRALLLEVLCASGSRCLRQAT